MAGEMVLVGKMVLGGKVVLTGEMASYGGNGHCKRDGLCRGDGQWPLQVRWLFRGDGFMQGRWSLHGRWWFQDGLFLLGKMVLAGEVVPPEGDGDGSVQQQQSGPDQASPALPTSGALCHTLVLGAEPVKGSTGSRSPRPGGCCQPGGGCAKSDSGSGTSRARPWRRAMSPDSAPSPAAWGCPWGPGCQGQGVAGK